VKNETHFWRNTWPIWAGGKPKRIQRRGQEEKVLDAIQLSCLEKSKTAFTAATKIKFDESTDGAKDGLLPFMDQF
jgi:hypothetical protein